MANTKIQSEQIEDDIALGGNPTTTTQSAGNNTTRVATTAFVTTAVANLVDSAPSALDTLNELAAAMGDDASFSTTITNSIATKLPLAGGTMTGDLILGDNVKLEVGSASGGDLQIYHDTNHSYIEEAGTGALKIKGDDVRIENASGNNIIKAVSNSAELYENGSKKLETTSAGVDVTGRITATSNHSQLTLTDSDDSKFALVSYSSSKYIVRNNSTSTSANQFTLTEDGLFGIGTTSPSFTAVSGSTSQKGLHIQNSGNDTSAHLKLTGHNNTGTPGQATDFEIIHRGDALQTIFQHGGADVLTFDSSGNVLLGTNTTSAGNEGVVYFKGDSLRVTRDGNEPLVLDRLTNQGKVIELRQAGTTRGLVGTVANDLFICTADSGHNGLRLHADGILPTDNAGAIVDGDADLGISTHRFKDLYLSGNVKVASGKGIDFSNAPNSNAGASHSTLDDYEEGAFSPTLFGGGTQISTTGGTVLGRYTKIGNLVSIWGVVERQDATSVSGNLSVQNLPFPIASVSGFTRLGMGWIWMDNGSGLDRIGQVYMSTTPALLGVVDFSVRTGRYLQMTSLTNGRPVYFCASYQTDN